MSARPGFAFAAALVTVLLWSSSFPLIGIALRELDPAQLAALRFALAGALMGAWLARRPPVRPSRGEWGRYLAVALLGVPVYQWLLGSGQTTVSAGAASFIVNTSPVMTAMLAVVMLNERFPARAWVGTALSLVGVGLIASEQPGGLQFGSGAMLVFGAAVCQAVYFIVQRQLVVAHGPLASAALVMILGAVLLLPWLPSAVEQARSASLTALGCVVYLGIFPASIGSLTWNIAQQHYGPARASNFLYLVPPGALGLSVLLTGEVPGWATWAGGIAAIGGVVLVNTRGRK